MTEFPTEFPKTGSVTRITISPENRAAINEAMRKADEIRRVKEAHAVREAGNIFIDR